MCNGTFSPPKSVDLRHLHEAIQGRNFRMKVRRLDRERRAAAYREAGGSSDPLREVNWEAALKGTEQGKSVLELSQSLARRAVGMMAFKRKYYSVLFDKVWTKASGYAHHGVISKKWEKVFTGLEAFSKTP